jgi:hypothetical protein
MLSGITSPEDVAFVVGGGILAVTSAWLFVSSISWFVEGLGWLELYVKSRKGTKVKGE